MPLSVEFSRSLTPLILSLHGNEFESGLGVSFSSPMIGGNRTPGCSERKDDVNASNESFEKERNCRQKMMDVRWNETDVEVSVE
jgi:hypothetical protein